MSIRLKLTILLLLIGLVPAIIVGVLAYATIDREIEDTTILQLEGAVARQEQRIEAQLQEHQEVMSQLVNQFDLQVALEQFLETSNASRQSELNNILRHRSSQSLNIQNIYLTDTKGAVLASTLSDQQGKSIADKIDVSGTKQYSIRVYPDERDGLNRVYMTTPVSVNNERVGFITIIFRIDSIIAAAQDYTGLGETGETIIAGRNENGGVIALFPLRFDTDAALKRQLDSLDLYNNANTVVTDLTDYRGQQVLMTAVTLDSADWIVATKIDVSEAFAPVRSLQNALVVIVLIASILIAGIALLAARHFTGPIVKAAQVARRIGKGDFSARVEVARHDEVGVLGESVNAMGENLENLVAHINEQRTRLEIILNNATESILAIDKDENIIMANNAAAELVGQPADTILGQHINDVFAWKQNDQPIAIYYDTPDVRTYPNLQFTSPDGTLHYLKLIIAKVKHADPYAKTQAIVTIHDETKSRELDDMKIDFVSMAAHELRTPLASLRGYLELLQFKEGDNVSDESKHHIRQALKSTAELGGLINNLLDVTRIERGALVVTPEKIDLGEIVAQAVQDIKFSADDKKISISYTPPPESYFVNADVIAIREVMNNLLTNAVKYTSENGHVEVTLTPRGADYAVAVRDTGMGIPERALKHLFTKFYRVHGGLDSGSNGTGLGLYIAKSIVERHHGTIEVESEVGVGSTFTFTLPRYEESSDQDGKDEDGNTTRRHRGWVTKNITR